MKTLHIDCTADGLKRREVSSVFTKNRITLQTLRACQQIFSAAFVAYVESNYGSEAEKNALCTVVPHPDFDTDYPRILLSDTLNARRWSADQRLNNWLENSRVDGFTQPGWLDKLGADELRSLESNTEIAINKLTRYLNEADRARLA